MISSSLLQEKEEQYAKEHDHPQSGWATFRVDLKQSPSVPLSPHETSAYWFATGRRSACLSAGGVCAGYAREPTDRAQVLLGRSGLGKRMCGGMRGVCAGADRPGPGPPGPLRARKRYARGMRAYVFRARRRLPSHGLVGAAWLLRGCCVGANTRKYKQIHPYMSPVSLIRTLYEPYMSPISLICALYEPYMNPINLI